VELEVFVWKRREQLMAARFCIAVTGRQSSFAAYRSMSAPAKSSCSSAAMAWQDDLDPLHHELRRRRFRTGKIAIVPQGGGGSFH